MVYLLWSRDSKGLFTYVEGIFDSREACLKYVQWEWKNKDCAIENEYIAVDGVLTHLMEYWNVFTVNTDYDI